MYSDHLMANSSNDDVDSDASDKVLCNFSSRIVGSNCIGCHGYLYKWNMWDQLLWKACV